MLLTRGSAFIAINGLETDHQRSWWDGCEQTLVLTGESFVWGLILRVGRSLIIFSLYFHRNPVTQGHVCCEYEDHRASL